MTDSAVVQPRRSYLALWMITVGHGLTHWYPATFFLLLPVIAREFGLTYSQVGLIMFVDSITTAAANVPAGMLVDLVGQKRKLMALALFGVGLPYLLLGVSDSLWAVLLCVTFTGVGNNLWHPTAIPTLADLYPNRKGFALSLHSMAANAGDAVAPVAVGALLGFLAWRRVVVINLVPGVLMAVATLYLLRHLGETGGRAARGKGAGAASGRSAWQEYLLSLKLLLQTRKLFLIALTSGLRAMTQKTLTTFLPLYLANVMGYPALWVGAGMALLQGAGFVAAPISGHMSDKVGRRRTLVFTTAMTCVALVVMALAGRSPLFIALVAVVGFFLFAIRPVMQAWVLEAAPKQAAGTSVGVLFGVQAVGSSLGPLVGGLVADRFGLTVTFYFVAGTILLANLSVLAMPNDRDSAA